MRLKLLAALPALFAVPAVFAQTAGGEFTVGDIRIEGLQRISEGTVFNYLPVNIGDRLDQRRIEESLRALYGTGFFRDVELRRDGGTLVVAVRERPSIESFTITGNKDIKTEDLEKSLRNVGLARGKTFNQSTLDEVERFLTDQYYSRGKYAVRVDTKIEELPDNRVKIAIDVAEGKRARIRQINVVGNEAFSDEDLTDQFKLKTPNWLSWYRQDDRYSREELSGDIEKLRSYYMDRGYANFDVETTQVAIAPEKDDIYVTLNVKEGDVYRVSDVKIAGNLVVPESDLMSLVQVRRGDVYSRKMITQTTELMALRLGRDGYAFAKIDPVPQENKETKEIALTFVVEPGNRAYVRHVNFKGTTSINDDVLRREMRQMEGGYLSNAAVERSKQRLQRLPYIEKVEVETTPVAGTPDLVDVDFDIKEGLPGQFSGGIGYSESQSFILSGSFVHSNFMGTGNRVAAEMNGGQYSKVFSLSHTDPYTTVDGVSRTRLGDLPQARPVHVRRRRISRPRPGRWDVDYAWPITEFQSVRDGTRGAARRSVHRSELERAGGGRLGAEQRQYLHPKSPRSAIHRSGSRSSAPSSTPSSSRRGWSFDSRNRSLFADRGARHRLGASYTLPGSDVEYFTRQLRLPAVHADQPPWFTIMWNTEIGYGDALGDTTSLPPFRNYFAGGPEIGARLPGERLGTEGLVRQPVRRQPEGDQASSSCCCRYPRSGAMLLVSASSSTSATCFRPTTWISSAWTGSRPWNTSSGLINCALPRVSPFSGSPRWASSGSVMRIRSTTSRAGTSSCGHHVCDYGDETEGFQFSIGQAF